MFHSSEMEDCWRWWRWCASIWVWCEMEENVLLSLTWVDGRDVHRNGPRAMIFQWWLQNLSIWLNLGFVYLSPFFRLFLVLGWPWSWWPPVNNGFHRSLFETPHAMAVEWLAAKLSCHITVAVFVAVENGTIPTEKCIRKSEKMGIGRENWDWEIKPLKALGSIFFCFN